MKDSLQGKRVLLASASPRRRELMAMLDIPFEIAPTIEVDESYPADLPAEEVPVYLSRLKADAYRTGMQPYEVIITADTVVILDGKVLGKPHDLDDARRMLAELSGKVHTVVTGVTITRAEGQMSFSATTEVEFAELTPEEIYHYVTVYRPIDKAGAYGIQEWIGAIAIRSIRGSYYNVMGLPLHRLYHALIGPQTPEAGA
ncbi:MAG: Maf family nucleotide pyrophosphatase [Bacteroidales bacterium]|nr:Maf family nucleotide pyrophosphatase [Bacteroidales bacterium]